jgi:uncharacterized protein (TIGR03435 family)
MSRKVGLVVASALFILRNAPHAQAQPSAALPKFEAVAIKPSHDRCSKPVPGPFSSPGRITECGQLRGFIQESYILLANGRTPDPTALTLIDGLPKWADSEYFEVVAKAEGAPAQAMMHGPMMQALLEDRFKLKVHREKRDVPVYVLSVAKDGPKLIAAKNGSCTPQTFDLERPFSPPASGRPLCGRQVLASEGVDIFGITMAELCYQLFQRTDRIVIDKTGIAGMFDIHLDLAPEDRMPASFRAFVNVVNAERGVIDLSPPNTSTDPPHSSIFDAVKKLGLKLESGKGPREFVVVDHVEQPSAN